MQAETEGDERETEPDRVRRTANPSQASWVAVVAGVTTVGLHGRRGATVTGATVVVVATTLPPGPIGRDLTPGVGE